MAEPVEVWDQYCTKPKRVLAPRKHKPRFFDVSCESWYTSDQSDGTISISINFTRGRLSAPVYNPMKRLVGKPGTVMKVKQWNGLQTGTKGQDGVMVGPFTVIGCRTNHNGRMTLTYRLDA